MEFFYINTIIYSKKTKNNSSVCFVKLAHRGLRQKIRRSKNLSLIFDILTREPFSSLFIVNRKTRLEVDG